MVLVEKVVTPKKTFYDKTRYQAHPFEVDCVKGYRVYLESAQNELKGLLAFGWHKIVDPCAR